MAAISRLHRHRPSGCGRRRCARSARAGASAGRGCRPASPGARRARPRGRDDRRCQGRRRLPEPSMGRVVGRPPEWFEGRSPLELMPPEDAARGRAIFGELVASRRAAPRRVPARGIGRHWRRVEGSRQTSCTTRPYAGSSSTTGTSPRARAEQTVRARSSGAGETLLEGIISAEGEAASRIAGRAARRHDPGDDRVAGRARPDRPATPGGRRGRGPRRPSPEARDAWWRPSTGRGG